MVVRVGPRVECGRTIILGLFYVRVSVLLVLMTIVRLWQVPLWHWDWADLVSMMLLILILVMVLLK